jgi:hypothetical protein
MLYKVADRDTGSQISLVIRKLSPKHLMDFEELFVQVLSTIRARSWLCQGMGTTMAFVSKGPDDGRQEVLVLSRIADVCFASSTVESVTIAVDNLTYSRKDVDDVEITHYTACELTSFLSSFDAKPALQPKTYANIVIHYRGEVGHDSDIAKTTVRLEYNTKVQLYSSGSEVMFEYVDCTGTTAEGQSHDLPNARVCIRFAPRQGRPDLPQ